MEKYRGNEPNNSYVRITRRKNRLCFEHLTNVNNNNE